MSKWIFLAAFAMIPFSCDTQPADAQCSNGQCFVARPFRLFAAPATTRVVVRHAPVAVEVQSSCHGHSEMKSHGMRGRQGLFRGRLFRGRLFGGCR